MIKIKPILIVSIIIISSSFILYHILSYNNPTLITNFKANFTFTNASSTLKYSKHKIFTKTRITPNVFKPISSMPKSLKATNLIGASYSKWPSKLNSSSIIPSFATTLNITEVPNNYENPGMAIIYIAQYNANSITACEVSSNNFTNCKIILNGLAGPEGLLVINQKLYILNMNNDSISICNLNEMGSILNCHNTQLPLAYPVYLAYNDGLLYITGLDFQNLLSCTLSNTGNLIQCNNSTNTNLQIFTTQEYSGYSYSLTYESGSNNVLINKCINVANIPCSLEQNKLIVNVFTFVLNAGYVYLSDMTNCYIVGCNIDSNGNFTQCTILKNNLALPTGLAIYPNQVN